ncbi:MAG: CPBP family intramembrane metalloprotease [Bacteroidales bacterium]|jgi:membrane protease YdiL (CAAX protease family)|nr:CPBP family intramembrane metalloprotease [Bacteroidales bacterium]MDX9905574.1 CPBP family intramembrane glutamic endopeptidase [Bacteroidales bacterium]
MEPDTIKAVYAILATAAVSVAYYFVLYRIVKMKKPGTCNVAIGCYLLRKFTGFLLLGILPVAVAWFVFGQSPAESGFRAGTTAAWLPYTALVALFLTVMNYFNSSNIRLQKAYPELRLENWGPGSALGLAFGWILYLVGYEMLFRGLLLHTCLEAFGLWPAILINLSLYFILHLPKGLKESVATIPFGAVVIFLTVKSGSVLPAILLHSIQAVSFELFCIYRNPEMKFNQLKIHQL